MCCMLAVLCACQPAVDSGRLDAAMSEARLGAVSRQVSAASGGEESALSESSAISSEPSSQPVTSEPTTAELAQNIEIPIVGDKLTEDPQYIPTEEEMKEDDPQYQQPSREEPEEDIVDTLPPSPPPASGESGAVSIPSQLSSVPSDSAASDTAASEPTVPVPQNGWYTDGNGDTYYYVNGQPATGWQTSGGIKYYFNDSGVLSSDFGVDVSVYQGNIDWNAVKAAGVKFVMIRVGYRGYGQAGNMKLDTNFVKNLEGAQAAGIDCGVYFFSQAITRAEAVEEAKFVLEAIKGYQLTYPVAFDTEYYPLDEARTNQAGLTDKDRTDFAIDFCQTIRDAGYYPTIYANKSWLLDDMEMGRLSDWDIWLAHYTNQTDFQYPYQIWQYSESGKVDGISSNAVDMNVSLKDYPQIIRAASAENLALTAAADASSNAQGYPAAAAADGWASGNSRWMAAVGDKAPFLQLNFPEKKLVNTSWCSAYTGDGKKLPYALEYWDGETWREAYAGDDIGYSRQIDFPSVYTEGMRLRILEETAADSGLSVWEWSLYEEPIQQIYLGDYPLEGFSPLTKEYDVLLPAGVGPVVSVLPADRYEVRQDKEKALIYGPGSTEETPSYTLRFSYVEDPAVWEVYNAIEALPVWIAEENYEAVINAINKYEALDQTGKAAIVNYPRLQSAKEQLPALAGIYIGDYPLPGFSPDVWTYDVSLPAGVSLSVTALPERMEDTCTVSQTETAATVQLAFDGGAVLTYTIAFSYVEDPAVLAVYYQIEALPLQVEEADRPTVEAARAAYEQLGDKNKQAIINLPRLEAAEKQLVEVIPGDLDGDGSVTIADVMEACKILARKSADILPSDNEIAAGDLDGDGGLTIADVMEICKILARQA